MEAVQTTSPQKARYDWVDALKFLGISSIYVGHMGTAAGTLYPFTFQYCVALFFLASGFFAPRAEQQSFWPFLKKKLCTIVLPYFAFSAINLVVDVLTWGCSFTEFVDLILAMFMGVRTKTVAAALWFLPCLFVISIGHYALKKFLRKDWLVVLVSLGFYIATEIGIPYRPVGEPRMFFGIDSAMCYILYYALGAVLFPYLKEFHFHGLKLWAKVLFWGSPSMYICSMCRLFQRTFVSNRCPALSAAKSNSCILFSGAGSRLSVSKFYRLKIARSCESLYGDWPQYVNFVWDGEHHEGSFSRFGVPYRVEAGDPFTVCCICLCIPAVVSLQ